MSTYELVPFDNAMAIVTRYPLEYGCITEVVWKVSLRPSDAGFSLEDFPVRVDYSDTRKAWYFERSYVGGYRSVYFERNHVSEKGVTRTYQIPDKELTPEIVSARIAGYSVVTGTKVIEATWEKGKISKNAKRAFRAWAYHVRSGGDWNASALWDSFYKDLGDGQGNVLYQAVEWAMRRDQPSGKDIYVLQDRKEVPHEVVGIPDDVDWCAVDAKIREMRSR